MFSLCLMTQLFLDARNQDYFFHGWRLLTNHSTDSGQEAVQPISFQGFDFAPGKIVCPEKLGDDFSA